MMHRHWSPILIASIAAAAVAATLLWAGAEFERARDTLVQGEGVLLLTELRRRLDDEGRGPPSPMGLQRAFASLEDRGLRYLRLPSPPGRPLLEAGEARGEGIEDVEGVRWLGPDRVRWVGRPPPPPGARHPGPRGGPPPPGRPHAGPPKLVLEFQPTMADLLEGEAKRVRWGALVAVVVIFAAGLIVSVVFREQSRQSELRSRDRRLAVLGRTSAVLAHEIRNPLASLKGHAQLLHEVLPKGRARDKAEQVVGEARRIERLIEQLLDFLRSGKVARSPVAMEELVQRALERSRAGRCTSTVTPGELVWCCDAERIERCVVNLLDNAEQAAPGGAIDVAAWVEGSGARSRLCFTVSDRGPGFEGNADQWFDPLATGRRDGVGLGLAFVREVVEAHGGLVRASLRAGGGAVLRIELPRTV